MIDRGDTAARHLYAATDGLIDGAHGLGHQNGYRERSTRIAYIGGWCLGYGSVGHSWLVSRELGE